MCEKCLESAKKHYPNLSEEDIGELLMRATAFPFGSPELINEQLTELKEKTDGTLAGAINFAHEELDKQMAEFKGNP